ncbi:MAG: ROK family protein [Bacteroidales bacterium]|nr:ROK family protein [Bacteroidales bacterium]
MYAIGIDIGGTNTDIGLVNPRGEVVARKNLPTGQYTDANQYADDLANTIKVLIDEQKVEVKGIGIGAPNGNFYTGCIENAPNLNMKGNIYLAKMLEERLHLPAVITNDANAAAYGEMIYGGAKGMKHFIMFTLGTGVGSGIIVDGKLLYGHDGFAGELGHTIVFPTGRPCKCGRQGCLEQYTSAGGIRKTCLEMMKQDPYYDGILSKIPAEELNSKAIGDAANEGDPLALRVFEFTGGILGLAMANAVAFSSPEAVFLMGGPVKAGEVLLEPVRKSFNLNVLSNYKDKVKIMVSQLKQNDVAILGAAALVN